MKYDLVGIDGNAFSVMGYVKRAMKECGFSTQEIDNYVKDAMSSNYDHLLQISMEIIDQCNDSLNTNEEVEDDRIDSQTYSDSDDVDWSYFKKFEKYNDEYLPDMGDGDTMASQMCTALCKLIYKWYNDGDVYDNQYGMEGWANDISGSANWLYNYIPETQSILKRIKKIGYSKEGYEHILKDLADTCYTDEMISKLASKSKVGDAYNEDGPFEFVEYEEDEDEYYDEYDDEYYESRKLESPIIDDSVISIEPQPRVQVYNSEYTKAFDNMLDKIESDIRNLLCGFYPQLNMTSYSVDRNLNESSYIYYELDCDEDTLMNLFKEIKDDIENYIGYENCVDYYIDEGYSEYPEISIDVEIPDYVVEEKANITDIPKFRD